MARRGRSRRKHSGLGCGGTLFLLFFVLLAAAGGAAWLLFTPFGPQSETFVEIPAGSSATRIGRLLEASGIVRTRYAFDAVRIWKHGTLRAGEYRFDHPASVFEVYGRIQHGDVYTKTVVVPEGSTMFDIAARLEEAGLGTREEFLQAAVRDTNLIADIDPRAKSLEGYLFPDTYHLPRRSSADQIAAAMAHRFRQEAEKLGLKDNVRSVVTLASLVERESALDTERPLVASVFENRLAKQMPLMTDPSVIYGLQLQHEWRGAIYASDLKRDTPYNTYLHAGMPPGPIANPGVPSLRAAMEPAHTGYLYFVAAGKNPQGHSLFAETLEEHNRNVAGYRKAVKTAGAQ
ncbi:MAG TPA: endolytic transglycosylase MltG [Terracidiphilus sp.]|nr:endolytic transglycosylase MltG [Terracidiphilus sp.]